MLATVAPRWPKAFTKIGFGTIAIILFLSAITGSVLRSEVSELRAGLDMAKDKLEEAYNSPVQSNMPKGYFSSEFERLEADIDQLSAKTFLTEASKKIEALGEKEGFIYGAAFLFISYLVGEILVYLGNFVTVLTLREKEHSERVARVAHTENSVIQRQFEDLEGLQTIVSGLVGLVLVSFFGNLVGWTEGDPESSLFAIFTSWGTTGIITVIAAFASMRMARTLDLTLDELASFK